MNRLLDDLKYNFKKENNGLIQLILINVVVFVVFAVIMVITKLSHSEGLFNFIENNFYLSPDLHQFVRKPWTLITYFFIHSLGDIFHIVFNMLGLYWFGRIVQEYIGNRRMINIYLLGGIIGGLTYILLFNVVPYFNERGPLPVIGASGSVYAIAVAAATLVPDYTFFLVFLGPVRIIYIVAVYIFISFLGSVGPNAGGNICHLGGALLGFFYIYMLRKGTDLGQPINFVAAKIKNFSKPKMKITYRKNETAGGDISQKDIDLILDKINRSGYESLSKEEKQKLFKASQK